MRLIFEQHLTGGDRNFGYLIGDESACALIDPSYNPDLLVERAKAQNLQVEWLLNTHSHHDHTNGNARVQELCPAVKTAPSGDQIQIGSLPLFIIPVPGHTPEHVVFYQPTFRIAFTGDHLFVGKIGGTSNEESARLQYDSLHKLLNELPLETTIWPGHNVGCRPSSTLAIEKASNPFLLASDFQQFLTLKSDWSSYKARKGLL